MQPNDASEDPAIEDESGPRLVAAYPQALVSDVTRAADFYRERLGFHVVYLYGEPPFYALVERGGARINLRHVDEPARHRPPGDPDVLTANIPVQGIESLFEELQVRGVDFAQTLKEQPWAASDFLVRDPDGNLLCFANAVEDAPGPTRARPEHRRSSGSKGLAR